MGTRLLRSWSDKRKTGIDHSQCNSGGMGDAPTQQPVGGLVRVFSLTMRFQEEESNPGGALKRFRVGKNIH